MGLTKPEAQVMKLEARVTKLEAQMTKLEARVTKLEVQVHCSWQPVLEEERERLSQEVPRISCRSSRLK